MKRNTKIVGKMKAKRRKNKEARLAEKKYMREQKELEDKLYDYRTSIFP